MEGTGNAISALISSIGTFLTAALGYMTQVLTWAISEPLVMFFLAIGLAGVMFRWAKSMLHI